MAPIVRARLYEVALRLKEPFVISGGTMAVRRSLVIALEDAEGVVGYGEAAPFEMPFYSEETVDTARLALTAWLLPRVVGGSFDHSEALCTRLTTGIRGHPMARAGVETAWWDLEAARRGRPLAELVTDRLRELGVRGPWLERRPVVECGVALGIPAREEIARLRRSIAEAVDRGYRRVKLKIRPGWDRRPVETAQEMLRGRAPAVPLTVDANGAYDPARDRAALAALDAMDLLYIEQPFPPDALLDTVSLAQTLKTPVCLDESLTSTAVARQLLAMDVPMVWNIKVQRLGGLDEACRVYALAASAEVRLWGGTMPETGLGAQTILALGAHGGFVYPSDLEPSERWWTEPDLVALEMRRDGTMIVPVHRPVPVLDGRADLVYETSRTG